MDSLEAEKGKKYDNRVIYFNDQTLHFNRIDRDEIKSVIYNLK